MLLAKLHCAGPAGGEGSSSVGLSVLVEFQVEVQTVETEQASGSTQ